MKHQDSNRTPESKARTLSLKARRAYKGSRYYKSGDDSVQAAVVVDTNGQHFTKNKFLPNRTK